MNVVAKVVAPTSAASLIATSNQDLPIVRVNGVEIPAAAIAQEMQYHPSQSQREAAFLAAQALVLKELLCQQAQTLAIQAVPRDDESAQEALIRTLLEQEVSVPEITDAQLEQYYQSNAKKFTSAPLLAARHILLAADPQDQLARAQAQDQALALLDQLNQGADFAELATAYSACPSKQLGGELGQLSKGQTVPEFERAVLRLPEGLASTPIESRYGYHVVDVLQRVEGELLPLHAVKERISAELSLRVWHKAVAQYLQIVVAAATIEGIVLDGAQSPLLQ